MDFRLELNIKPFAKQINIRNKVMLMGSCFTEHMGKRFSQYKFETLENPNGILFNPVSITNSINSYIQNKKYTTEELFLYNELWQSWDHHSQYSHPDQATCLQQINNSVHNANDFLKKTDWLIITLGSSFVYELKNENLGGQLNDVAANCHKVPATHFNHRLLSYAEVDSALQQLIENTKACNKKLQIIFTISPVRHAREGLVENNRSKALLHTAIHAMIQKHDFVQYFPSYELLIDDLRDYRYYAEDMVHPNYQATQYVWDKFEAAVIDDESKKIMLQLLNIQYAKNHKPFHPQSTQHLAFLAGMFTKTMLLSQQYPFLDLTAELAYFRKGEVL